MIKAIIFDCFGVLVRDGWLAFRDEHFRGDSEKMKLADEVDRKVDAGLITYEEFIQEVAVLANVQPGRLQLMMQDRPVNNELFEMIRSELKHRYKIGMLSNAATNWLHELFRPEDVALFDEIVLSFQIGTTKPDPVTYEMVASKLGVLPEECLFIDDQERYCEGARKVGMEAVHYRNNGQISEIVNKINSKS